MTVEVKFMPNKIMKREIRSDINSFILSESLADVFSEYRILEQVYAAGLKEVQTKLEILDDEFSVKYDYNPIHHMEYRLKSPKSIVKKVKKKNVEVNLQSIEENLLDIAGIRVICNYEKDIYRIFNLLTKQNDIEILEVKDYLKNPKPSGYRSLHLVVSIPVFLADSCRNVPVEIQIRTVAMDYWASLEHHLKYKNENSIPDDVKERLLQCANVIASVQNEMESIHNELYTTKHINDRKNKKRP